MGIPTVNCCSAISMKDPIHEIETREDMHTIFNQIYAKRQRRPSLKILYALGNIDLGELSQIVLLNGGLRKKYKVVGKLLEKDLFRVTLEKKTLGDRIIKGTFIIDSSLGDWIIFSIEKYNFTRAISRFIKDLYPDINGIYLNYIQILDLLDMIKKSYEADRVITQFRILNESKIGKEFKIMKQTISGVDIENELIKFANESQRIWLERVAFQVIVGKYLTLLKCFITSEGLMRLSYGNFTQFYNSAIISVHDTIHNWNERFGRVHRELVGDEIILTPCSIVYNNPFSKTHFDYLQSNIRHHYLTSIMHSGNPYFAADLCDYEDGSSFMLTILGSKITISPMIKTTNRSLWLLVERLQRWLGEGKIMVD